MNNSRSAALCQNIRNLDDLEKALSAVETDVKAGRLTEPLASALRMAGSLYRKVVELERENGGRLDL